jgi:hypothetical protein
VSICRRFDDKNDIDNEGDDSKEFNQFNGQIEKVLFLNLKARTIFLSGTSSIGL